MYQTTQYKYPKTIVNLNSCNNQRTTMHDNNETITTTTQQLSCKSDTNTRHQQQSHLRVKTAQTPRKTGEITGIE